MLYLLRPIHIDCLLLLQYAITQIKIKLSGLKRAYHRETFVKTVNTGGKIHFIKTAKLFHKTCVLQTRLSFSCWNKNKPDLWPLSVKKTSVSQVFKFYFSYGVFGAIQYFAFRIDWKPARSFSRSEGSWRAACLRVDWSSPVQSICPT